MVSMSQSIKLRKMKLLGTGRARGSDAGRGGPCSRSLESGGRASSRLLIPARGWGLIDDASQTLILIPLRVSYLSLVDFRIACSHSFPPISRYRGHESTLALARRRPRIRLIRPSLMHSTATNTDAIGNEQRQQQHSAPKLYAGRRVGAASAHQATDLWPQRSW